MRKEKRVLRMNPFKLIRVAVLTLACITPAFAQSTGTIQGVVRDPSGAVIPNAAIAVTNASTRQTTKGESNAAGTYTFAFLPPGQYSLTADHAGFTRFQRENIQVDLAAVVV